MKKRCVSILLAALLAAVPCLIAARRANTAPMRSQAEAESVPFPKEDEQGSTAQGGAQAAQEEETPSGENAGQHSAQEEETAPPEQAEFQYARPESPRLFLLPGEEVVNSYQELKSALEGDNGITTVYFGSDITMQIGGIRIHPGKKHVTVSGIDPTNPDQSEPYTLIDYSSASFYSTIYIDAAGISSLTVRDMNITGKNYYGPFSVYDSSLLADVLVVYERVNYNGPQLGYHRRGTIAVTDCTVRIHGANGGSANQEFSEAKHLVFSGFNTIHTESGANSVFWHPGGGSFTLGDDSTLSIVSPNTSAAFGVFYADLSLYKIDIDIGERAHLNMTISGAVAPEAYSTINSLTVREGGRFYLKTTKSASADVLRVGGALTVEKEAEFIISGYGGGAYSLLRQEGGDIAVMKGATFHIRGESAYLNLINLVGRSFVCDDPLSVLLYNANRNITASGTKSNVYMSAQQINYWNAPQGGGLDSPPLHRWDKADKSNFIIEGTISTGAAGDFTEITSNFATGDSPGAAPDASSFSMRSARVLALGRLELVIVQLTAQSGVISGVTMPGATVRASFSQQGEDYTLSDAQADSYGAFHIPVGVALMEGTAITVMSNWQYLTTTARVVVSGGGSLEFFVPESLEFFTTEISPIAQRIKRMHTGWEIIVSDARGSGGGWSLYARLESEMRPSKAGLPPLAGALVHVDGAGGQTVMSADFDVLIASRKSSYDEVSIISWDEDKGILLLVKPGAAFAYTAYTASIIWTLIDAP